MKQTSNIVERLKAARKEQGLTINELAEKANISSSALSCYERGLSQPTIEVVEKVATALGFSVREFFIQEEIRATNRAEKVSETDELYSNANFLNKLFEIYFICNDASIKNGLAGAIFKTCKTIEKLLPTSSDLV